MGGIGYGGRRAKADLIQKDIVKALRRCGATVVSLHRHGCGVPDILVGYRGVNHLLEIKREGEEPSKMQSDWADSWGGAAQVVHNETEALRAVGAL
jgi:hypothetical protein